MPAPGDQHRMSAASVNPFEDNTPKVSEYTAAEIATLQSRLEKQLGPEYISARAGPGGQKIHYLAAEKVVQLANEVFGFNGWSSQIMEIAVDFVDENPQTYKVSLGLSVTVRVTLRDGTFHEDIGYGHIENCKGKAAAFEKAKKEGTTDGLKRALKNFGNVLGNCIYDKDYISKVTKIKVAPAKWDIDQLYRHASHGVTQYHEKRGPEAIAALETKPQMVAEVAQPATTSTSTTPEDAFDDDFGDFDEADFSVSEAYEHPDEVAIFPVPPPIGWKHSGAARNGNNTQGITGIGPNANQGNREQPQQQQQVPPGRPLNGAQAPVSRPPQPQTPNNGTSRSNSGVKPNMQPPQRPPANRGIINPRTGHTLNQPNRPGPASAPGSPGQLNGSSDENAEDQELPPPGTGFTSARAAKALLAGPEEQVVLPRVHNLQAFDAKAESPSIRKTAGVDHSSTKALNRQFKVVPPPTASQSAASAMPGSRTNSINPPVDAVRRIGAPGSPSPLANRNSYKPPTMTKRPIDNAGGNGRAPLSMLPANGSINDNGGDAKRQRLSG